MTLFYFQFVPGGEVWAAALANLHPHRRARVLDAGPPAGFGFGAAGAAAPPPRPATGTPIALPPPISFNTASAANSQANAALAAKQWQLQPPAPALPPPPPQPTQQPQPQQVTLTPAPAARGQGNAGGDGPATPKLLLFGTPPPPPAAAANGAAAATSAQPRPPQPPPPQASPLPALWPYSSGTPLQQQAQQQQQQVGVVHRLTPLSGATGATKRPREAGTQPAAAAAPTPLVGSGIKSLAGGRTCVCLNACNDALLCRWDGSCITTRACTHTTRARM